MLFCHVFKEGRTAKDLEHVSSAKFFPYFPYKRRVMLDKENLDKHVTISCELEFKKKSRWLLWKQQNYWTSGHFKSISFHILNRALMIINLDCQPDWIWNQLRYCSRQVCAGISNKDLLCSDYRVGSTFWLVSLKQIALRKSQCPQPASCQWVHLANYCCCHHPTLPIELSLF